MMLCFVLDHFCLLIEFMDVILHILTCSSSSNAYPLMDVCDNIFHFFRTSFSPVHCSALSTDISQQRHFFPSDPSPAFDLAFNQ